MGMIEPNAEDENGPYWDPWEAIEIHCGGYNSEVDADAIAVLKAIRNGGYVSHIAKETGLSEAHVELWQYIFCSADWCDYGTSPRGCFPMPGIDFPALIAAWETYYERSWGERP